jgi:hypothetical protein
MSPFPLTTVEGAVGNVTMESPKHQQGRYRRQGCSLTILVDRVLLQRLLAVVNQLLAELLGQLVCLALFGKTLVDVVLHVPEGTDKSVFLVQKFN